MLEAKLAGKAGADGDNDSGTHVDPAAIAKAKAQLSQGLGQGEDVGQTKTAFYKGKSMELGKGGRSLMMQDRITLELVNKGYSLEKAQAIAKKQAFENGVKKYGAQKMDQLGKAAADQAKAAKAGTGKEVKAVSKTVSQGK